MANESVSTARKSEDFIAAITEIGSLHCEMEAVVDALFSTLEGLDGSVTEAHHKRAVDHAYRLTMVLRRGVNEVGRQVGAI